MTITIDGGAGITFPDTVQQTNGMTMTGGNPKYYAARAWVNFNGTGTVAIRASVNVSSITDNGTGDYTVNFSAAMPDANYCYCVYARASAGATTLFMSRNTGAAPTTSAFRFVISNSSEIDADVDMINAVIFR